MPISKLFINKSWDIYFFILLGEETLTISGTYKPFFSNILYYLVVTIFKSKLIILTNCYSVIDTAPKITLKEILSYRYFINKLREKAIQI